MEAFFRISTMIFGAYFIVLGIGTQFFGWTLTTADMSAFLIVVGALIHYEKRD